MRQKLVTIVVLAVMLQGAMLFAQVPALLPIQGTLFDAEGRPVMGPVSMQVSLYADEAGTSVLHTEPIRLELVDGFFTVYLGAGDTPLDPGIFALYPRAFLGVAVEDDPEMELIEIATAPYAAFAALASEAATLQGGLAPEDFVLAGNVSWSDIHDVPAGLEDDADVLGGLGCDLGDVPLFDGDAWTCAGGDSRYIEHGESSSITGEMLGDDQVASRHVVEETLTSAHIVDGSIRVADLRIGEVDARYVNEAQSDSVTAAMLTSDSVGSEEVLDDSLTSDDLADEAVGSAELAADSVTSAHIANDSVTAEDIAAGAVGSSEIANRSITGLDIAAHSVTGNELASVFRDGDVVLEPDSPLSEFNGSSDFHHASPSYELCVLSLVEIEGAGACEMNGTWVLRAQAAHGSGNNVRCQMMCFDF